MRKLVCMTTLLLTREMNVRGADRAKDMTFHGRSVDVLQ